MHIETLSHGDLSCEVEQDNSCAQLAGKLKYRAFDVGRIAGRSRDDLRAQFAAICDLIDSGGMVRHGIVMLGYHNNVFKGDVLLVDGEIIGEWVSDDEEWCHFTANDASEITCSAPSPWMLHDAITAWVESCSNSKQV
ncbi:hypothetical protein EGN72_00415 [Pseudorhodobacter sp. E13]|nr:hypothetical protein EGN72_00415 [Pseudorhodobacter sp. E13]